MINTDRYPMDCGAVPCVAFNHALSWEKCRYDLTAWNRHRGELTGSDDLQSHTDHTVLTTFTAELCQKTCPL